MINNKLKYKINNLSELECNISKIMCVSELINKLKFSFILQTDILNYDIIDSIWLDYISQKYKNNRNHEIINFAVKEFNNSCILEKIFSTYIEAPTEDLVMVYQKGASQIIYYLKSYKIINKQQIPLPYYRIDIPTLNLFDTFNDSLEDNEILISCI